MQLQIGAHETLIAWQVQLALSWIFGSHTRIEAGATTASPAFSEQTPSPSFCNNVPFVDKILCLFVMAYIFRRLQEIRVKFASLPASLAIS